MRGIIDCLWSPQMLPTARNATKQIAASGVLLGTLQPLGLRSMLPALVANASFWTLGGVFAASECSSYLTSRLTRSLGLTNTQVWAASAGARVVTASYVLTGSVAVAPAVAFLILDGLSDLVKPVLPTWLTDKNGDTLGEALHYAIKHPRTLYTTPLKTIFGLAKFPVDFANGLNTQTWCKVKTYINTLFSDLPQQLAEGVLHGGAAGLTLYSIKQLGVGYMIPAVITTASLWTLGQAFVAYSLTECAVRRLGIFVADQKGYTVNYNGKIIQVPDYDKPLGYNQKLPYGGYPGIQGVGSLSKENTKKVFYVASKIAALGAASCVLTGAALPATMVAMSMLIALQNRTLGTYVRILPAMEDSSPLD